MTLDDLLKKLSADKLGAHVAKRAGTLVAPAAMAVARKWSSGGWSLAELRLAGHPYRVGGPNPLDPSLINSQRGIFRDTWRTERPNVAKMATNTGTSLYLVNDSPEAEFMAGTTRMIERPVAQSIEDELRPYYEAAIMEAVEEYWVR